MRQNYIIIRSSLIGLTIVKSIFNMLEPAIIFLHEINFLFQYKSIIVEFELQLNYSDAIQIQFVIEIGNTHSIFEGDSKIVYKALTLNVGMTHSIAGSLVNYSFSHTRR